MGFLALVLLSILPTAVDAQAWRGDLESGQDALGLVAVVCLGIAFFYVKGEFKRSPSKGWQSLAICSAILVAAVAFEPVRWLLALVTIAFFIYGFVRQL